LLQEIPKKGSCGDADKAEDLGGDDLFCTFGTAAKHKICFLYPFVFRVAGYLTITFAYISSS
jgi:hypothetical protein